MRDGEETPTPLGSNVRILDTTLTFAGLADDEFCYVRVETSSGDMAWSSPFWGDETGKCGRLI